MSLYLGDTLISGAEQFVGESRNIGQIIPSTIPLTDAGLHLLDGALILGGGIYNYFVSYIADLYNNTVTSNVTKVGSITDTNGVLSGFSTSNYAQLPTTFNPSSNTWEMVFKVTTGNDISGDTKIFNNVSSGYHGCSLQISGANNFVFVSSTNGTSWDNVVTITSASANTTYWIKVEFTGSAYNFYVSTSSTFSVIPTATNASSAPLVMGGDSKLGLGNGAQSAWGGSIDLNESYINIGGKRWWTGRSANGFVNETDWQTAVTTYGVCGKFVYDSVANTVRLPKYNSKIYTGGGNAPVKGNGLTLGLTDGTHYNGLDYYRGNYRYLSALDGLYGANIGASYPAGSNDTLSQVGIGVTTDGTKSGIIADLANITTSLDGYYYIVLATSTKTDIEVDIDEIATDLNGKADVDLTNVTLSSSFAATLNIAGIRTIVETYVNGTSWYRVYSDGWCEQGGVISAVTTILLKPYIDTNYIVLQGFVAGTDGCWFITNKTTTSFTQKIKYYGSGEKNNSTSNYWQACGYIR